GRRRRDAGGAPRSGGAGAPPPGGDRAPKRARRGGRAGGPEPEWAPAGRFGFRAVRARRVARRIQLVAHFDAVAHAHRRPLLHGDGGAHRLLVRRGRRVVQHRTLNVDALEGAGLVEAAARGGPGGEVHPRPPPRTRSGRLTGDGRVRDTPSVTISRSRCCGPSSTRSSTATSRLSLSRGACAWVSMRTRLYPRARYCASSASCACSSPASV